MTERALLIHPILPGGPGAPVWAERSPDARLGEAEGLARAIGVDVIWRSAFALPAPRPSTLIGQGRVEELRARLDAEEPRPGLVLFDARLSPVQHRNLEKALDAKVLDRTALILEIFGARAQTAEGRLQVDLAHLDYQRSRLVRSWTHLERQRGGAGFLGGPGERQIEADRRALADKIIRLRKKLEEVRRTRSLQRAKRQRAPHPVIALVGYTNAGKSTLFNRLTQADVMAKDLLFATLDPTMRAIRLASGERAILSDTVGFISDLPTELIAAFRATLEEVLEADVIVHVRDASHPDAQAQREDVASVLRDLGVDDDDERPFIEALNKIDLLDEDERDSLLAGAVARPDWRERAVPSIDAPARVPISAATGEGVPALMQAIDALLTRAHDVVAIAIPESDGAARAFLHQRAEILDARTENGEFVVRARLSAKVRGQFFKAFPSARLVSAGAVDSRVSA